MPEKEKQIEEIQNALPHIEVIKAMYNDIDFAKYLYDKDIRKLPKDSVVLSKEEYENIYEQAEQNVLANIADGGTSCDWCIKEHEKKASKETAEKIIDLIKTFCPDKKFIETITQIIRERCSVEIKE